jgi:hypothetical protein
MAGAEFASNAKKQPGMNRQDEYPANQAMQRTRDKIRRDG